MRRSNSAVSVFVLSVFCLVGCSAGHPAPYSAPSAPPPAPLSGGAASHDDGPSADRAETRTTPVVIDQISVVIQESNDKYLLGEEAYRAGDLDRARAHFDAALLTFMTSGLDVLNEPRLREAYDRMARDIQSLEAEALASPDGEAKPDANDLPADELKDIKQFLTPEELASEMRKVKPLAEGDSFSIPVVLNERVLTLIQAWQLHFTKAFASGYQRMGRYEPMIRRVLREEGLPEDLIYLAFTESTFKPSAYSRARAKGIWQFMASTGSRYGLTRNAYVDERSDPEKATRAAAQYLKELYGMFGDWSLVLASYNCGEGLVQKAMARTGKNDYWDLMTTRYFRNETKNFVPSIMALSLMSRDPSAYGFEGVEKDAPIEFDRVTVDGPADLSLVARLSGTTPEAIKDLNPELTRAVTPPGVKAYQLRVPKGAGESFQTAYASLPLSEKIASVRVIAASSGRRRGGRAPAADFDTGDDGRYTVRSGDTLSDIARQFGMSVRSLTSVNGITEKSLLFPGQSLKVRVAPGVAPAPSAGHTGSASSRAKASGAAEKDTAQKLAYKVRPGDNLYRIARRYGTSVDELRAWNGLKKSGDIYPGDMLTIYAR